MALILDRTNRPKPDSDTGIMPAVIPPMLTALDEEDGTPVTLSGVEAETLRQLLKELAARRIESMNLYEPLPSQRAFHMSRAPERLARGSNRGGKTLPAAVELAWLSCGRHPWQPFPKENARIYCIGKDETHCGTVMWRKLSRPGAFRIIRDEETDLWRSYRPWSDTARVRESKLAPPLIPQRYIRSKGVAYAKKRLDVPKQVTLMNGTEITFFSSLGKPPQGVDIDACLAGWSRVYDPVLGTRRRVDEIDGPFHVLSYNQTTGEIEVREATKPFVKGHGELCRVELSDGRAMHTTRQHRVLGTGGEWVTVQDALTERIPLASAPHAESEYPFAAGLAECSLAMSETPRPVALNSTGRTASVVRRHPETDETDFGDSRSYSSPCDELTTVYVTRIVGLGEGLIWDIGVAVTHNYLYGGTVSHNCWFDEEIVDSSWYEEMAARLLDRATYHPGSGKFFWSATPEVGAEQIWDLHLRCEDDYKKPACDRVCEEFVMLLADNPFIGDKQKQQLADKIGSEEVRRVKIGGEFAINSYRIFPEYTKTVHNCKAFAVPADWMRVAVVDPGRQVCAVLFAAFPPPKDHKGEHVKLYGDFCYLYDELYIRDCDAVKFAEHMRQKAEGQQFHSFVIDMHMGRTTQVASGLTVEEQYSSELAKAGVRSEMTGSGFIWGSDDVPGRINKVASWLRIRPDGTTKLRVMEGKCPNFEWEIERYRKRKVNGVIVDQPVAKHDHEMTCLQYLAMYDPRWCAPKKIVTAKTAETDWVKKYLQSKLDRKQAKTVGPFGMQTIFGPKG